MGNKNFFVLEYMAVLLTKILCLSFYFISVNNNPSKKISNYSEVTNYNQEKNNAYYYFHFENDLYSIIQSGREWYGEIFSPGQSKKIPLFEFIDNSNLSINLGLVSRSTVESNFSLLINNQELIMILYVLKWILLKKEI